MQPAREVRHTPVLLPEALDSLDIRSGGAYIDCTVGEGGHALAVLDEPAKDTRLLGIDLDRDALETATRQAKAGWVEAQRRAKAALAAQAPRRPRRSSSSLRVRSNKNSLCNGF